MVKSSKISNPKVADYAAGCEGFCYGGERNCLGQKNYPSPNGFALICLSGDSHTIRRSSFPLHHPKFWYQKQQSRSSRQDSRRRERDDLRVAGQFERRNSEFIFIPVAKSTKSTRYLISHSPHLNKSTSVLHICSNLSIFQPAFPPSRIKALLVLFCQLPMPCFVNDFGHSATFG